MIHLIVHIKAHNGKQELLKKYLSEITEKSSVEKGAIQYEYFLHPTADNTFLIYERWADINSLTKHRESEHFLQIVPKIQAIGTLEIIEFEQ